MTEKSPKAFKKLKGTYRPSRDKPSIRADQALTAQLNNGYSLCRRNRKLQPLLTGATMQGNTVVTILADPGRGVCKTSHPGFM